MPGIEDLTNIMMAGGRPDVPMGPPGPPPQAGPSGPPPQVMGGPMMANQGPPPPDMMADQIPTEEAAPDIEQDSMALAEAVVGRAQGDIQMAVTILDTAKAMLMQNVEQPPQMMNMGGELMGIGGRARPPRRPTPAQRVVPRPTSRQMQQQAFLRGGGGRGWNMGGPLYAFEGRALSDSDIDDTEVLKQMIMDGLQHPTEEEEYYKKYPDPESPNFLESLFLREPREIRDMEDLFGASSQEGRTISDKDEKRFRDYQPEGLLKGTIFDYVPDPYQISNWLSDKFGYPGIDTKGAGRAESDRDRTISDMISDEELRNEMRMLEREEPSSQRDMTYDEALEYLQQTRQRSK